MQDIEIRRKTPFLFSNAVALCFVSLFACSGIPVRGEVPLLTLYNALMAGTNAQGSITFEREIAIPENTRPAFTNMPNLSVPDVGGITFLWEGEKFLVAFSPMNPSNNLSVAKAERLYGFDGTNYWRLLNNTIKTYKDEGGQAPLLAPIASQSYLTVISTEEALHARDKYVPNSTFTTINELATECRRVAQLGFSFPLQQAPIWLDSVSFRIFGLGKGAQLVNVTGDTAAPETLTYSDSTNALPRFKTTLSYTDTRLAIDRLSSVKFKPVVTTNYRVLSSRIPDSTVSASAYSWQTYKADARNVVAEVAKDGATVRGQFKEDGQLEAQDKIITPAKPFSGHRR